MSLIVRSIPISKIKRSRNLCILEFMILIKSNRNLTDFPRRPSICPRLLGNIWTFPREMGLDATGTEQSTWGNVQPLDRADAAETALPPLPVAQHL